MDVAILVAVVGLVGVIIGGLINTGTTILLDRRRERVHRQRESRDYARDLKRASRLIDAQLLGARAAAVICVEKSIGGVRMWICQPTPGRSIAVSLLPSCHTALGWR